MVFTAKKAWACSPETGASSGGHASLLEVFKHRSVRPNHHGAWIWLPNIILSSRAFNTYRDVCSIRTGTEKSFDHFVELFQQKSSGKSSKPIFYCTKTPIVDALLVKKASFIQKG